MDERIARLTFGVVFSKLAIIRLLKEYDMEKHITVLGILYIVFGGLGLLAAAIVFTLFAGGSFFIDDESASPILAAVGTAIALFLALTSIPGIVGGMGVLKRQEWARILVLILGFLNLINIPFGTALGIYTIWVLMNNEIIAIFGHPVGAAGVSAAGGPAS